MAYPQYHVPKLSSPTRKRKQTESQNRVQVPQPQVPVNPRASPRAPVTISNQPNIAKSVTAPHIPYQSNRGDVGSRIQVPTSSGIKHRVSQPVSAPKSIPVVHNPKRIPVPGSIDPRSPREIQDADIQKYISDRFNYWMDQARNARGSPELLQNAYFNAQNWLHIAEQEKREPTLLLHQLQGLEGNHFDTRLANPQNIHGIWGAVLNKYGNFLHPDNALSNILYWIVAPSLVMVDAGLGKIADQQVKQLTTSLNEIIPAKYRGIISMGDITATRPEDIERVKQMGKALLAVLSDSVGHGSMADLGLDLKKSSLPDDMWNTTAENSIRIRNYLKDSSTPKTVKTNALQMNTVLRAVKEFVQNFPETIGPISIHKPKLLSALNDAVYNIYGPDAISFANTLRYMRDEGIRKPKTKYEQLSGYLPSPDIPAPIAQSQYQPMLLPSISSPQVPSFTALNQNPIIAPEISYSNNVVLNPTDIVEKVLNKRDAPKIPSPKLSPYGGLELDVDSDTDISSTDFPEVEQRYQPKRDSIEKIEKIRQEDEKIQDDSKKYQQGLKETYQQAKNDPEFQQQIDEKNAEVEKQDQKAKEKKEKLEQAKKQCEEKAQKIDTATEKIVPEKKENIKQVLLDPNTQTEQQQKTITKDEIAKVVAENKAPSMSEQDVKILVKDIWEYNDYVKEVDKYRNELAYITLENEKTNSEIQELIQNHRQNIQIKLNEFDRNWKGINASKQVSRQAAIKDLKNAKEIFEKARTASNLAYSELHKAYIKGILRENLLQEYIQANKESKTEYKTYQDLRDKLTQLYIPYDASKLSRAQIERGKPELSADDFQILTDLLGKYHQNLYTRERKTYEYLDAIAENVLNKARLQIDAKDTLEKYVSAAQARRDAWGIDSNGAIKPNSFAAYVRDFIKMYNKSILQFWEGNFMNFKHKLNRPTWLRTYLVRDDVRNLPKPPLDENDFESALKVLHQLYKDRDEIKSKMEEQVEIPENPRETISDKQRISDWENDIYQQENRTSIESLLEYVGKARNRFGSPNNLIRVNITNENIGQPKLSDNWDLSYNTKWFLDDKIANLRNDISVSPTTSSELKQMRQDYLDMLHSHLNTSNEIQQKIFNLLNSVKPEYADKRLPWFIPPPPDIGPEIFSGQNPPIIHFLKFDDQIFENPSRPRIRELEVEPELGENKKKRRKHYDAQNDRWYFDSDEQYTIPTPEEQARREEKQYAQDQKILDEYYRLVNEENEKAKAEKAEAEKAAKEREIMPYLKRGIKQTLDDIKHSVTNFKNVVSNNIGVATGFLGGLTALTSMNPGLPDLPQLPAQVRPYLPQRVQNMLPPPQPQQQPRPQNEIERMKIELSNFRRSHPSVAENEVREPLWVPFRDMYQSVFNWFRNPTNSSQSSGPAIVELGTITSKQKRKIPRGAQLALLGENPEDEAPKDNEEIKLDDDGGNGDNRTYHLIDTTQKTARKDKKEEYKQKYKAELNTLIDEYNYKLENQNYDPMGEGFNMVEINDDYEQKVADLQNKYLDLGLSKKDLGLDEDKSTQQQKPTIIVDDPDKLLAEFNARAKEIEKGFDDLAILLQGDDPTVVNEANKDYVNQMRKLVAEFEKRGLGNRIPLEYANLKKGK